MNFRAGDLVVVTGAAQGIGRAIALRLAAMGARLALWDIDGSVANTAGLCRERGAARAESFEADVGHLSSVEDAARTTELALGPAFGLVNNAGIFPRGAILDVDPAVWERVLRVNLIGPFLCARMLAPAMMQAGRGAIVNISSSTAIRPTPRGAHYAASKAGIISLTKSLALEFAPAGIRVNCVLPGIAHTAQPLADMTLEEMAAIGKTIPLGRIGRPEDTAAAVAFLLGDDAAYITGQSIAVNGGSQMWP